MYLSQLPRIADVKIPHTIVMEPHPATEGHLEVDVILNLAGRDFDIYYSGGRTLAMNSLLGCGADILIVSSIEAIGVGRSNRDGF